MIFRDLRLRVRALLSPRAADRDLQDELAFHVEREAHRLEREGLSRVEAQRAARLKFGSTVSAEEACRDERGTMGVESLAADVRFGLRYFAKRPLSVITMILVFALGVGFNTALFVFSYAFFDGRLPGAPANPSVVRIRGIDRTRMVTIGREFSYPEFRDYAAQDRLFSQVAAWTSSDVTLGVGDRAETLVSGAATYVTPDYFEVLGVLPILGTGLSAGGTFISHVVWERHFDSAPDVVGRTMKVNGGAVTIAGVLPRRFAGARTGGSHMRAWLPLESRPALQRSSPIDLTSYEAAVFGLVARLQPDVRVEQTLPTVRAIAARAAQQVPEVRSTEALSTDVVELRATNYFPPGDETPNRAGQLASLVTPIIILLITCTSVSALQAGLAMARRREIAVRLALGASRRRIVRQLLTESVMLACAAGALAIFTIWVLWRMFDSSLPDIQLVFHWPVFLFSFGVAVAAGLIFGISPALHATRISVSTALKETPGTAVAARSRLQSTLVVAQIAFTQPALLMAGAILLNLSSDARTPPGTPLADRVMDVRFNTNPRYGSIDDRREASLDRLRERLAGLPGIVAVVPQKDRDEVIGVVDDAPQQGRGSETVFVPGVRTTSHFLIRTQGPAEPAIQEIRAAAAATAPELPIVSARTLASIEADQRRSTLRIVSAAGGAGAVALFLTAIGLYAVVAFAASHRVREIGIRGALGASRDQVIHTFLRRGLRLAMVGASIGWALSLILVRVLGVTQSDLPPEYTTALAVVIAFVMIAVATLATWIPARRAADVDPIQVLRAE